MKRLNVVRYFLLPAMVGLLATAAVYWYVLPTQTEAKVAVVNVVVAKTAVAARTPLTADALVLRPFPRDYLPQGAITALSDAVGKVTVAPLAPGQVVVAAALAGPDNKTALAYHIPDGMVAVTLPVNEVTGVGGFVQVGDHVDVVGTFTKTAGGKDVANLLMQDLVVLGVGQSQVNHPDAKASLAGYTSLTLAVTPRQAVLLALAANKGELRMALRPAKPQPLSAPITLTTNDLGGQ